MKTTFQLLTITSAVVALAGCCCTNNQPDHPGPIQPGQSPTVTNIVITRPQDRSFTVGENVFVVFTAQGCVTNLKWTFDPLPPKWAVLTNLGTSISIGGEAPVGSSVVGIALAASASCGTNQPFRAETRLVAKTFVKEMPALNQPVRKGTVWADYSVNLGRGFTSDSFVQGWATVGIDTGGLIKTDGIQIVSQDANSSGLQHTLDQIDGRTKLSVNPRIPFESGEQFDVEDSGFRVFMQHPFHIRLFFADRGANEPDRYKRRDTHQVGLIRVEVK
jgi:hypothetical protein